MPLNPMETVTLGQRYKIIFRNTRLTFQSPKIVPSDVLGFPHWRAEFNKLLIEKVDFNERKPVPMQFLRSWAIEFFILINNHAYSAILIVHIEKNIRKI